jgi:hypothetical protein
VIFVISLRNNDKELEYVRLQNWHASNYFLSPSFLSLQWWDFHSFLVGS